MGQNNGIDLSEIGVAIDIGLKEYIDSAAAGWHFDTVKPHGKSGKLLGSGGRAELGQPLKTRKTMDCGDRVDFKLDRILLTFCCRLSQHGLELLFGERRYAELLCFGQLGAGLFTNDEIIRGLTDSVCGLGPQLKQVRLNPVAGVVHELSSRYNGFAKEGIGCVFHAQKFESMFYANPDLRNVTPPPEPTGRLDLAGLIDLLQRSPELASALARIISMPADVGESSYYLITHVWKTGRN